MDLLASFKEHITAHRLFTEKDRLLLAVSGGLDSVVLCELCHRSGFDFAIAHANFQLRGAESDRDEQFVRQLAAHYSKEVFVQRFDTTSYAEQQKVSIQVAARELRYEWFPTLPGFRYIVTAHHLDDNIETLLMNFFKGTGIAGLRAMLPAQGHIVRPLLFAKRAELQQFAGQNTLTWVEDSSNISDKYTRNFFRHQVIPLVQQHYPGTLRNLADNIDRFREIEAVYQQAVGQEKQKLFEYESNEIHIPVLKVKKTRLPLKTLVYEIIRHYGFTPHQTDAAIGLLDSPSGKYIASSTHRILKDRNWWIITPLQTNLARNILIESPHGDVFFDDAVLHLDMLPIGQVPQQLLADPSATRAPKALPPAEDIAWLDAAHIQFPLLLRKWQTGDYFYPFGMQKKKKLSRFFIDNKLSLADKEKVWVLEMNKKIIWIVGWRIDDRFRVTPGTRQVLKLERRML